MEPRDLIAEIKAKAIPKTSILLLELLLKKAKARRPLKTLTGDLVTLSQAELEKLLRMAEAAS